MFWTVTSELLGYFPESGWGPARLDSCGRTEEIPAYLDGRCSGLVTRLELARWFHERIIKNNLISAKKSLDVLSTVKSNWCLIEDYLTTECDLCKKKYEELLKVLMKVKNLSKTVLAVPFKTLILRFNAKRYAKRFCILKKHNSNFLRCIAKKTCIFHWGEYVPCLILF